MARIKRKPLFGIALGGGARGFAHIGVLKVFEGEGIKPDVLSGTSMGGIIAALYASGMSAREIEEEAHRMGKLSNMVKLLDNDLTNFDHVFGSESIQEYFSELLGGKKAFKDMEIPLALSAVDLNTGKEIVIQEGSVVEAINATMALPGIVEPVERDGMVLTDGGTLNNVPSDLVKSMGTEKILAVDVHPDAADEAFWQEQALPSIAAVSWRSVHIMIGAITEAKQRIAKTDLIIRPEIPSDVTTLTGFRKVDQVVDSGAKAALDKMPEIRKLVKERIYFFKREVSRAESMTL